MYASCVMESATFVLGNHRSVARAFGEYLMARGVEVHEQQAHQQEQEQPARRVAQRVANQVGVRGGGGECKQLSDGNLAVFDQQSVDLFPGGGKKTSCAQAP
jgi:hypothetical protein